MRLMNYKKFLERDKEIAYLTKPIEIRFDVKSSEHVWRNSKWRHGFSKQISDDEIVEMIEDSMETLTIDLMHDNLDVGERFILKRGELHLVCLLAAGDDYFTMTVITVMRKDEFRKRKGQYVLDTETQESYFF